MYTANVTVIIIHNIMSALLLLCNKVYKLYERKC